MAAAMPRLRPHQWLLLATTAAALVLLLWGAPDRAIAAAFERMDGGMRAAFGWVAELGDSKWYLYPAGAAVVLSAAARRWVAAGNARAVWDWLIGALAFVMLSVGLSGVLVNVVKWAVGRPRPNLFTREDIYTFQSFTFDARFHSFPSGHVNTLIVLGLLAGFFVPRLRLPLVGLAAFLALSRVAENAHYLSDFFGGAAIAIATTYWLRARFAERGWVFAAKGGEIRVNRRGRLLGRWLRTRLRQRRAMPAAVERSPSERSQRL